MSHRPPQLPVPGPKDVTPGELLAGGNSAAVHRFTPERNLNERLASDVLAYSTPDLLRYEDKNSMAFSIEARVPFLDHEMVETPQQPLGALLVGLALRRVLAHHVDGAQRSLLHRLEHPGQVEAVLRRDRRAPRGVEGVHLRACGNEIHNAV